MMNEWVTVIALCYNHGAYLEEALDSIQHQTYPYIELIIVDDASTDDSAARIQQWIEKNNKGIFIKNSENIGNCKSFNKAFKQSKGAFIIDFSLDDVMMHDKIEKQFLFFKNQPAEVGVLYSNVAYIQSNGTFIKNMYEPTDTKFEGNLWNQLIARYTINPISMMVRRQVYEYLNGYDESLTYEDFDFWIRSAYCYEYKYIDFVSCKKRLHHQSLSSAFNKIGTQSLDESTYKVCLKINWLRKSEENKKALLKRLEYEISHSIRKLKMSILLKYFKLYLSVYFN